MEFFFQMPSLNTPALLELKKKKKSKCESEITAEHWLIWGNSWTVEVKKKAWENTHRRNALI